MVKNSGVYSITNTITGHRYIGSAVNIRRRWLRHKNELRKKIHHNYKMQSAWNKYSEKAFEFTVLVITEKELLIEIEQQLVDALNPRYNICSVVTSPMFGRKHSKETKRKISQSHIGLRPSEETRKLLSDVHKGIPIGEEQRRKMSESSMGKYRGWADKPILQLSKDGKLICRYSSIMDAQRATNIKNQSIVRCAKGKRPSCGGFIWRYAESECQ